MANKELDKDLWHSACNWGEVSFYGMKRALEDPTVGMNDRIKSMYDDFKKIGMLDVLPLSCEYAKSVYTLLFAKDEYERLYKDKYDPNKLTKWQRITGQVKR